MSKALPFLGIGLIGLMGLVGWASHDGVGLAPPKKKPLDVREGSAHITSRGHHRTHYFVGGGLRHGK